MASRNLDRAENRQRRTGPPIEPEQFEAVREAGLAVASELSIDKVLQKLVDLARDLVNARYAALGVAREDRRGLSRFIVSGLTEEEIREIGHWPVGLGLLGVLLREPRPLRVKDISKDPRSVGVPPRHPKMTSFLGVPIMSKGRILGNLYLTNKIGADEFSEADESLIVLFAAHAAIAVENARLYTETDQRLKEKIQEVERAEQKSSFLAELGSLLPARGVQVDLSTLEQVAARITDLLGDVCVIYLLDPENPETVLQEIAYHRDPMRAQSAKEVLKKSWDAIRDDVIGKRRAIFVGDLTAKPIPFIPLDPKVMRENKFNAGMILPLKTASRLYGVVASLASVPLTLSEDDLAFGQLIAERLAVSLENTFLFKELTAALEVRDEFISIATHELKTPITSLKGFAQAAARAKGDTQLQQRALETINRQADRLARLIDELLDVARIRAGKLELRPERVNLVQLTSEVVQRFEVQTQTEDGHRFIVSSSKPEIVGEWDPTRIDQVLTNLISNAVKYSPEGGEIDVALRQTDDTALISVTDHGIGIPREQQQRIFEPFYRAPNVSQLHIEGTGLGLSITKEIVERHGGRIWFESEEGKGTTFYVELPLTPQGK